MRKTLAIAVAALALTLSMASVAFAQSSVEGYNPDDGTIQDQIQGGGGDEPGNGDVPQSDDGGSLPFTGLDIALLAGAGGVLLGVGVGMRRLTRAPDAA